MFPAAVAVITFAVYVDDANLDIVDKCTVVGYSVLREGVGDVDDAAAGDGTDVDDGCDAADDDA